MKKEQAAAKKEEQKMKRALRAKKKGSSKKKRRRDKRNGDGVEEISIRVKRRLNIASPKVKCNREELKQCVSAQENVPKFPRQSNKKKSVQMNTFIDRRVSTEAFLHSLE